MLHNLVANVGSTSLKYKLVSVRLPESEQAEYRTLRRVTSLYQPLHRTTCPRRITTARHIPSPRRQFICMHHPRGQSIDTSMGFSPLRVACHRPGAPETSTPSCCSGSLKRAKPRRRNSTPSSIHRAAWYLPGASAKRGSYTQPRREIAGLPGYLSRQGAQRSCHPAGSPHLITKVERAGVGSADR